MCIRRVEIPPVNQAVFLPTPLALSPVSVRNDDTGEDSLADPTPMPRFGFASVGVDVLIIPLENRPDICGAFTFCTGSRCLAEKTV